ncbi:MAG TPA: hypothetical protein VGM37_21755 [Armatimonadota bacterium]|jgi:hypothetical protein
MASNLYEWLGVPADVEPEMVGAAALLGGVQPSPARAGARVVLSDPGAREDYDARSRRGLAFELSLAWGIGAASSGDPVSAARFFREAAAQAPDDRAAPLLLAAVESADAGARTGPTAGDRSAAREQAVRLKNNSAFPHRLVRYVTELSADPPNEEAERSAQLLVQRDMAEAPRAYAMILPVLREHYPAAYGMDAAFFDASISVLERHTPSAEYERGKQQFRRPRIAPSEEQPAPSPEPGPTMLPRLRLPSKRLYLRFGKPSISVPWLGLILGALIGLTGGSAGAIAGAGLGYIAGYALQQWRRRR